MITDIQLQHFRSYDDASFDFGPDLNIIIGPNASGKTNLLESLLVMASGGSYRVHDAELVAFGQPWARIDAVADNQHRAVKLVVDENSTSRINKQFEIDEQNFSRLSRSKSIPVVLFEPNHLLLLSSVPDLRRAFLDDLIEQTDTGYGAIRRHYRRILSQRNALLKNNPVGLHDQLFVWNLRLSELGGKIAHSRSTLIEKCNQLLPDVYNDIAKTPAKVALEYRTKLTGDYETALLRKLEQSVELDVLRGYTAYGPHRDDLAVLLDGHVLQESASRGEIRTMVLALKIIELKLIEEAREIGPLLLLDDVFSELDAYRRQALANYVKRYQTFITATEADTAKQFKVSSRQLIQL